MEKLTTQEKLEQILEDANPFVKDKKTKEELYIISRKEERPYELSTSPGYVDFASPE